MNTNTLRPACFLRIAAPVWLALPLFAAPAARAQYTMSVLGRFGGMDNNQGLNIGANPNSLTFANGSLFGTTLSGGANNDGEIFELNLGALTTVASFTGLGAGGNGESPNGLVSDSSGNLYGTTGLVDPGNYGTAFELPVSSSTIASTPFNGTNGSEPTGSVSVNASGFLYGATMFGGTNDDGTVFTVKPGAASTPTTIYNFTGSPGYSEPNGVTLDSNGDLFGTTTGGSGIVYEIPNGSSSPVTITTQFGGTNNHFTDPSNLIVDSNGNVYGTTLISVSGGADIGGVFEIASGTDFATIIATLGAQGEDSQPFSLTVDGSGNVFGTAQFGGAAGYGTVFEIAAGSGAATTIATFSSDGFDGLFPDFITVDSSGDLYGTTEGGVSGPGGSNQGTVFELTPVASAAAPEPGTLALLLPLSLLAAFGLARRHKRAPRTNPIAER